MPLSFFARSVLFGLKGLRSTCSHAILVPLALLGLDEGELGDKLDHA